MWIKYNVNPVGRWDAIDCAVRALTKALDVDWERAYMMLAVNGLLMGNMSCSDEVIGSVLREHGFYMSYLPDDLPIDYTVEDFSYDNPQGTFVLKTNRHVVTVQDGNIYDSFDSSDEHPIYVWYRRN